MQQDKFSWWQIMISTSGCPLSMCMQYSNQLNTNTCATWLQIMVICMQHKPHLAMSGNHTSLHIEALKRLLTHALGCLAYIWMYIVVQWSATLTWWPYAYSKALSLPYHRHSTFYCCHHFSILIAISPTCCAERSPACHVWFPECRSCVHATLAPSNTMSHIMYSSHLYDIADTCLKSNIHCLF